MNFYEALLHYVSARECCDFCSNREATPTPTPTAEQGSGVCVGCVAAPVGAKKLSKLGVRAPLCVALSESAIQLVSCMFYWTPTPSK